MKHLPVRGGRAFSGRQGGSTKESWQHGMASREAHLLRGLGLVLEQRAHKAVVALLG